MIAIFLMLIVLLSSCSFSMPVTVTVSLGEDHIWEQIQGQDMYYTLKYFDGEKTVSVNLDSGVRRVQIKVKDGGLRPVVAVPIGKLYPLGGFYYPGSSGEICLYREKGTFAQTLISASEYIPEAVSSLNFRRIESAGIDTEVIDQQHFMEDLYAGKVSESSFRNNRLYSISLDMLPSGYWYCDNPHSDSFYLKNSGDSISLKLFPGAYYWANFDRGIFFSLIITEKGEAYTGIVRLPKWY